MGVFTKLSLRSTVKDMAGHCARPCTWQIHFRYALCGLYKVLRVISISFSTYDTYISTKMVNHKLPAGLPSLLIDQLIFHPFILTAGHLASCSSAKVGF